MFKSDKYQPGDDDPATAPTMAQDAEPADAAEQMEKWQSVADATLVDALDAENAVALMDNLDATTRSLDMAAKYAAIVQAQAALRQADAAERANELAERNGDPFGAFKAMEAELADAKAALASVPIQSIAHIRPSRERL